MVDRIVLADAFATLTARLGSNDPVAVEAEPFSQWMIEEHFVNGRLAWKTPAPSW